MLKALCYPWTAFSSLFFRSYSYMFMSVAMLLKPTKEKSVKCLKHIVKNMIKMAILYSNVWPFFVSVSYKCQYGFVILNTLACQRLTFDIESFLDIFYQSINRLDLFCNVQNVVQSAVKKHRI